MNRPRVLPPRFPCFPTRFFAGFLLACLLHPRHASGSGVVTSCSEADLRAALAGGGPVTFACDGSIFLTSPLIVSNSAGLDAAGRQMSLSGSNATRLFIIQPGATLTLRGLSLVDGLARGTNGNTGQPGGPALGGAICNSNGTVNAYDCAFLRHRAHGGTGGAGADLFSNPGGGTAYGGAIYNWLGSVNVSNCVFTDNRADGGTAGSGAGTGSGGDSLGGALCNISGVVHAAATVLSNNVALSGQGRRSGAPRGSGASFGGAFYNHGDATLSTCQLQANSSIVEYLNVASGGALSHEGPGTLALAGCAVAENRTMSGAGMGISTPLGISGGPARGGGLYAGSGVVRITNSTIEHNLASGGASVPAGAGAGQGGGVFNGAQSFLLNCTLEGNIALGGEGRASPSGNGEGGGLYNASTGTVMLTHVTLARNAAEPGPSSPAGGMIRGQARGGAIASAGSTVTLRNTLLAYSLSGSNCFGTAFVDAGHNLSTDGSCPLTAPGSMTNTDPLLGPLADYGGPTLTVAPLAGSPAIDAGDPAFCPPTDQRGRARPSGDGCDVGAFESSAPFTVLGQVTGFLPAPNPVAVSGGAGPELVSTTGAYAIHGFTAGSYLLTPTSPECVFIQSNRLVQISTDVVGVDFHSYRSNALIIERISGPAARGVFAGEAGATYRVLMSPDLSSWTPWSTNTAGTSGLFEFIDNAIPLPSQRYFRVERP